MMNLAGIDIDEIVRNVLKEIQYKSADSSSVSATKIPVAKAAAKEKAPQSNTVRIEGRVVTADLLSEYRKRSSRIQLDSKAIITPAARDYIKEQGLQIAMEPQPEQATSQKTESGTGKYLSLVVQSCDALESATASVSRQIGSGWNQEIIETTEQAAERAKQEIQSGKCKVVLIFSEKTATAACLVNRNEKLRGVAIRRASDVSDVAELNANIVCIPGCGLSFVDYRNILKSVVTK